MSRLAGTLLVMAALSGLVRAEDLPPLPVWTPEDQEKLVKGEIVPGLEFFGKPTDDEPSPLSPLPEAPMPDPGPEEPLVEHSPTEIAPEYLERYFGSAPTQDEEQGIYLIDPQELLAQQEFRDRESFLRYHAGESKIDMYVYLFDARQELPPDVSLEEICETHFAERGPTAVIFYFLGVPDRAELVLSKEVRAVASQDEQSRALRAAVQEAFEKSDPAHQLDNFLVELSIRLYWIEREMAGVANRAAADDSELHPAAVAMAGASQRDQTRGLISRILILGGSALGAILLAWLMKHLLERRVRYHFPEVESGPLLGAPHAAGVGAVLSFSNAQIPPSQQRDEVPDYLQRM